MLDLVVHDKFCGLLLSMLGTLLQSSKRWCRA